MNAEVIPAVSIVAHVFIDDEGEADLRYTVTHYGTTFSFNKPCDLTVEKLDENQIVLFNGNNCLEMCKISKDILFIQNVSGGGDASLVWTLRFTPEETASFLSQFAQLLVTEEQLIMDAHLAQHGKIT